jgi:uncharacterized membrane protein
MRTDGKFAARVALFSALAYVSALISVYIPNVSLIFIVVFASGVLFGLTAGLMVGGLGMFLWTVFNPYGMASLPITISQIAGMMLVGGLGATISGSSFVRKAVSYGFFVFGLLGLATGLVFQIVVSLVLAWLYGPFWPSLLSNLSFALLTILSNGIIFTLCYPLLVRLKNRERRY